MAILNYTTSIDPWKTVNEIQQILSKHGATHFSIKNDGSFPVALSFAIDYNGHPLNFLLPCKFQNVLKIMKSDRKIPRNKCTEAQALRVSWRIVKDWTQSQLALIQVEMVKMEEVFMPYLIVDTLGNTLYSKMSDNGMKLLN